MGMQYNTHELHVQIVQQQVNLLQGQGTLLIDNSKRTFFLYKDPCHVNCSLLAYSIPSPCSNFDACRTLASTDALLHVLLDETLPNSDCEGNT